MVLTYVLSVDGKPLMPTTRCNRVAWLLKHNMARVVSKNPFTIRLAYDTPDITQSLILGIDPGRTNIGLTVIRETGESVYTAHLETRNKKIPKLMKARKQFRTERRTLKRRRKRQRRAIASNTVSPKCVKTNNSQSLNKSKKGMKQGVLERLLPNCDTPILCIGIKNKEARFNNRVRKTGWLTPTANHLFQTHLNAVNKICKILPVTKTVLEINRFAFMQLDNPCVKKWQYQRGQLFGYGNVEKVVYEQQDGHCIFCDKAINHYHHVVPRSKRGGETLTNRVGLCVEHHTLVHNDEKWNAKLIAKKQGMNKQYHALSVLNQIIPALSNALAKLFPDRFYATSGKSTYAFRKAYGINKDHHIDAYCIAASILPDVNVKLSQTVYEIKQFRRHDRQVCHKANLNRRYVLNGKVVATNRHKAMNQKIDSLEEYIAKGGKTENLTVIEHKAQHKRLDRIMPGAVFVLDNKRKVMFKTDGFHNNQPDYVCFIDGSKIGYGKCNKPITLNSGLVYC